MKLFKIKDDLGNIKHITHFSFEDAIHDFKKMQDSGELISIEEISNYIGNPAFIEVKKDLEKLKIAIDKHFLKDQLTPLFDQILLHIEDIIDQCLQ